MVLTAEKEVALVIMDKDLHSKKCIVLLNDKEVHKDYIDQTKSIHSK